MCRERCQIFGTIFPKNIALVSNKHIGLGFGMGFATWLRLGKNVMKKGWEEGVPILLGMKRWNPEPDGPGDSTKIELR